MIETVASLTKYFKTIRKVTHLRLQTSDLVSLTAWLSGYISRATQDFVETCLIFWESTVYGVQGSLALSREAGKGCHLWTRKSGPISVHINCSAQEPARD